MGRRGPISYMLSDMCNELDALRRFSRGVDMKLVSSLRETYYDMKRIPVDYSDLTNYSERGEPLRRMISIADIIMVSPLLSFYAWRHNVNRIRVLEDLIMKERKRLDRINRVIDLETRISFIAGYA